jgi:hypothetical protein
MLLPLQKSACIYTWSGISTIDLSVIANKDGAVTVIGINQHFVDTRYLVSYFLLWIYGPARSMASSFMRFLDHTQWRTTFGRISLEEWSARRRALYLTTHNTRKRKETDIHAPGGIRTHSSSKRMAADLRLRLRSIWDWLLVSLRLIFQQV